MPYKSLHAAKPRVIEHPNKRIHAAIVILMFLMGSDVFQIFLGLGGGSGLIKFVLLFPLLVIITTNFRHLTRSIFLMPELSALVALAILSVAWSVNPMNTLERGFPLLVTTSVAMVFGSMLSLRSLVVMLGFLASLVVFVSLIAIITVPSARGTPPWDDTWRGIFNHKNELGVASMFALLLSVSAAKITWGHLRRFFAVVAFGALLLLVASQSRTSQIIGSISIIALVTGMFFHRRAFLWAFTYIVLLIGIIGGIYLMFAIGVADTIIESFGREPTLSGRLPLWKLVWPQVEERFWLGYGFAGFWDPEARRVVEIARDITVQFTPFYSHNGLIETWLNAGFVGVVLFTATIIRVIGAALTGLRISGNRTQTVVAFTVIVAFLLLNIMESSILMHESLTWMIFVSVSVKLGAIAKTIKRVRAPNMNRYHWSGSKQLTNRTGELS